MSRNLSPVEIRVLGALVEKDKTTPDYYPLTLNALISACNQKSSRDPVMVLDNEAVLEAIDSLREERLAWMVQAVDARVPKYEHNLDKELGLTLQEVAIMCLLMLRGPQTLGEIRSRSSRIYPFEAMEEVSFAMDSLLSREDPLVMKLPLQPGRKEARYCHLLSGEPDLESLSQAAPAAAIAVSGSSKLAEEVETLRAELSEVRQALAELQREFAIFKAQFD